MSDEADGSDADRSVTDPRLNRRGFVTGAIALGGAATGLVAPLFAGEQNSYTGDSLVNPRLYSFVGGSVGGWRVTSAQTVAGEPFPRVERVDIMAGAAPDHSEKGGWTLRGVTSNERYVTRDEKVRLIDKQALLGRAEATHAALIPIRKNGTWWALTQDERRAVFEERSRHLTIGLKYLPAIARRLHHCRDLGESQPFDFLTLFDYAEADAPAFDDMLAELRATEEWKFVEREVDIRLVKADA